MSQNSDLPASLTKLALRGKEFKFWIIQGTCMAEKVWSESKISSTRNGYGQVSGVYNRNSTKREIWVRMTDGKERNFALPDDTNFAVRDGQQLSLVCVSNKQLSSTHFHYLAIVNHNTDKWVFLQRQFLIGKLSGVGSWIDQSTVNLMVLLTLGIGLIPIALYCKARYRTYVEPIEQHAEKIATWCFKRELLQQC